MRAGGEGPHGRVYKVEAGRRSGQGPRSAAGPPAALLTRDRSFSKTASAPSVKWG